MPDLTTDLMRARIRQMTSISSRDDIMVMNKTDIYKVACLDSNCHGISIKSPAALKSKKVDWLEVFSCAQATLDHSSLWQHEEF